MLTAILSFSSFGLGIYIGSQLKKAKKPKCSHEGAVHIWTDYQDAYVKHYCSECNETIYQEL